MKFHLSLGKAPDELEVALAKQGKPNHALLARGMGLLFKAGLAIPLIIFAGPNAIAAIGQLFHG